MDEAVVVVVVAIIAVALVDVVAVVVGVFVVVVPWGYVQFSQGWRMPAVRLARRGLSWLCGRRFGPLRLPTPALAATRAWPGAPRHRRRARPELPRKK